MCLGSSIQILSFIDKLPVQSNLCVTRYLGTCLTPISCVLHISSVVNDLDFTGLKYVTFILLQNFCHERCGAYRGHFLG